MMEIRLLVLAFSFCLIRPVDSGLWAIFEYLIENVPGPSSGDKDAVDPVRFDYDVEGTYWCAQLAGCKTVLEGKGCYGPSGTSSCSQCIMTKAVSTRNVMRADFYDINKELVSDCNGLECQPVPYSNIMAKYMLLKGDDVAISYQGAVFKDYDMPEGLIYHEHYGKTFCGENCWKILEETCHRPTVLAHVTNWCLTSLKLIESGFKDLRGPASMLLFLAARLGDGSGSDIQTVDEIKCAGNNCEWPGHNPTAECEEKAVLVASAAMSVLLAGHWWNNVHKDIMTYPDVKDFGFAVQHSLMLAVYDGRLRLTLHGKDDPSNHDLKIAGSFAYCDKSAADSMTDNYEGTTGTVYAALCSMFYNTTDVTTLDERKLRYQPEIHVPNNDQKCVEKKTGMVFIRPGDWMPHRVGHMKIGSNSLPLGISFIDRNKDLAIIEFTSSGGATLYPPSVRVSLVGHQKTKCTGQDANGPNFQDLFSMAGLRGIGGICNWVPVW